MALIQNQPVGTYEAKNGTCRYKPTTSYDIVKGLVTFPENDENALQEAVDTIGSVTIDFTALDELLFYHDGIYT